jgi:hypothetical protein
MMVRVSKLEPWKLYPFELPRAKRSEVFISFNDRLNTPELMEENWVATMELCSGKAARQAEHRLSRTR